MAYGPQEPYEPYESYDPYAQPDPYYGDPGRQPYQQGYQEPYQEPYPPAPPGVPDAQWAVSGMGWEQQAWDEARLGVSPLQDYGREQAGYGAQYGEYAYPDTYPEQYGRTAEPYGRASDAPSAAPGRGSRRKAPAPEEQYEGYDGYEDHDGDYQAQRAPSDLPHQRESREREAEYGAEPVEPAESEPPVERDTHRPARDRAAGTEAGPRASGSKRSASAAATGGRGAFGAAGLGAISAIAALASSSAVLVVVALVQLGVAYGWQLAAGLGGNGRGDRRSIVLTALTGWAASAVAFRLTGDQDQIGVPVALGAGFVLLAADQTLRRRAGIGEGERIHALAVAVAGALFAVLPAGFVVADRLDTGLTAASASAAAAGVLCGALLGRGSAVRALFAGLIPGAAVGALAATSFAAHHGLKAGALGGAGAGLAAAVASAALDRMGAEGELRGSTRIVAQVLPIGLAAIGAVVATAIFR